MIGVKIEILMNLQMWICLSSRRLLDKNLIRLFFMSGKMIDV